MTVGGCVGRRGSQSFFHLSFIPIKNVLVWAREEFGEEFYVPSAKELDEMDQGRGEKHG